MSTYNLVEIAVPSSVRIASTYVFTYKIVEINQARLSACASVILRQHLPRPVTLRPFSARAFVILDAGNPRDG